MFLTSNLLYGTARRHVLTDVFCCKQSQEDNWNYAQTGGNMCSGRKTPFDEAALVFLGKSPDRIGPVNVKARYVEYTDATFTTPRVRNQLLYVQPAICRV